MGQKNSVSKNTGSKNWVQKHCESKISSGQTLVKISLLLADICQYTETRTNDAGENVALSNVSKIVAI